MNLTLIIPTQIIKQPIFLTLILLSSNQWSNIRLWLASKSLLYAYPLVDKTFSSICYIRFSLSLVNYCIKISYILSSMRSTYCCYCCSVSKSSLTLCNPKECSTPGSSVLHYLLEFAQTHVH